MEASQDDALPSEPAAPGPATDEPLHSPTRPMLIATGSLDAADSSGNPHTPKSPRLNLGHAEAAVEPGMYADACIRIGPEYQCVIPETASGTLTADELSERPGDTLLEIDFTPLTEPPPPAVVDPGVFFDNNSPNLRKQESLPLATRRPTWVEETYDLDDEGLPKLPPGVTVGNFCLAIGSQGGERRKYKALLLGVREQFPPCYIKYLGLEDGSKMDLLLPARIKAYVNLHEVMPWVEPDPNAPPLSGAAAATSTTNGAGAGASSTDAEGKGAEGGGEEDDEEEPPVPELASKTRKMRTRPEKFKFDDATLLQEAGGLRLHWDPKRHEKAAATMKDGAEEYKGTGYKGVADDYWPTGYKKV